MSRVYEARKIASSPERRTADGRELPELAAPLSAARAAHRVPLPVGPPIQAMLARRGLSALRSGGGSGAARRTLSSAAGSGGGGQPPRKPGGTPPPAHSVASVSLIEKQIAKAKSIQEMLARMQAQAAARAAARAQLTRLIVSGTKLSSTFRFATLSRPDAFTPPIIVQAQQRAVEESKDVNAATEQARLRLQELEARFDADPEAEQRARQAHETGNKGDSPFLSTTTDPLAAATSDDGDLMELIQNSVSHLAVFTLPASLLRPPVSRIGISDFEHLFRGEGLEKFMTAAIPNPMKAGNPPARSYPRVDAAVPRFSFLPPAMVGALGEIGSGLSLTDIIRVPSATPQPPKGDATPVPVATASATAAGPALPPGRERQALALRARLQARLAANQAMKDGGGKKPDDEAEGSG